MMFLKLTIIYLIALYDEKKFFKRQPVTSFPAFVLSKTYLRSMLFKDVIGQPEVKQHLAEMVHQNRLSHALLFLGKEGSGALSLALAFAQFLVCEKVNQKAAPAQPGPSLFGFDEPAAQPIEKPALFESCGACSACTKAQQLIHPDIHYSYPVIPKKSGDKPKST